MISPLLKIGACIAVSLAVVACSGSDGAQGPAGPTGPTGPTGPAGPPGPNAIILTANTPAETFANLQIVAKVNSVTFSSGKPVVNFSMADPEGKPIIGYGLTSRASTATVASYPNLAMSLAKLIPASGGTPSKWVSYIVTTVPTTTTAAAPTRPSTDNTGTLVDNKDGTYVYTFYRDVQNIKAAVDAMTVTAPNNKADLGDLTWQPTLTHRLTIQFSGNAPGTGTNTPNAVQVVPGVPLKKAVDLVYDFVPSTGQPAAASANRKMTTAANCDSCHSTLGGLPGDSSESSGAGFHGGARNNVEYCVVCHTDQRKYGRTEATYNSTTLTFSGTTYVVDGRSLGDLPNMTHKIHLGNHLARGGYDYAGILFDKGGYSQDTRNCTKCHDGANPATPQGDNWKTQPSRLACAACHDGINFDTGLGVTLADRAKGLTVSTSFNGRAHPSNATDAGCANAGCHGVENGVNKIELAHRPVTPPNLGSSLHVATGSSNTNSAWIASNPQRLPTGAVRISYEVSSVSLNAARNPVMVFRILQNGARKDFNVFASAAANPVTGQKEIYDGFMGSPSAYFVWAVPQDGIATPADFNASASGYIRNIWNGSATGTGAGTLTGPDANGFYTVTLTGVVVPTSAVMFTGGVGYSYNVRTTMPLTQTNLPAYPAAASTVAGLTAGMPNAIGGLIVIAPNAQKVGTGFTGRRTVVEDARCNACHQELGAFTQEAFHGGQRNDGTTCSWCHTPNRGSSGWTAETANMTHAIHGAAKRRNAYTWHSISADDNFSKIKYPGVLARCEQCHLPGTYDFANAASADAAGLGADQIDKRQNRTVAAGSYAATDISLFTMKQPNGAPYLVPGQDYGLGFTFNAGLTTSGGVAAGATREAAATTLVMSPTVTACVGCHDSQLAISHMTLNGGAFYEARSTALPKVEQCFVCHASGKLADVKAVHSR